MSETRAQTFDELMERLDEAERRLSELHEALRRSHRLVTLGTLASIIAHEFNNLLTPVVSYCEMAMKAGVEADPELAAKALERSHAGARKAASIAESVLGFARPGEAASRCEVGRVVDDALHCMAREPVRDGIDLRVDIERGLTVAVPPIAMQQVLMNLLLNARRAMAGKGGGLTIEARRLAGDPNPGRAVIEVIDTGPGIAPAHRDAVFEPFVTGVGGAVDEGAGREAKHQPGEEGSGAGGPTAEGTGLGLAICRTLIEDAGGTIAAVEPRGGRGARFRIEVPAVE